MNHIETLHAYEAALGEQNWDTVSPLIVDNAVFIFSSGTFRGKSEIEKAFKNVYDLIKDETYRIEEVEWLFSNENIAICSYKFYWEGLINGQPSSGGGRGSASLRCQDGEWQIVHEHLGPHANN